MCGVVERGEGEGDTLSQRDLKGLVVDVLGQAGESVMGESALEARR
jgi:hypothetical protein